jgi:hypothetical protein
MAFVNMPGAITALKIKAAPLMERPFVALKREST